MLFRQAVCHENPRNKKKRKLIVFLFSFLLLFFFWFSFVLFCFVFVSVKILLRSGGLGSGFLPLGSLSRVPDVALGLDGNELLGFGDGSLCALVVTAVLGAFI